MLKHEVNLRKTPTYDLITGRELKTLPRKTWQVMGSDIGSMGGHPAVEQVHRTIRAIKTAFERNDYCSAVYLDVGQAFDKVWQTG